MNLKPIDSKINVSTWRSIRVPVRDSVNDSTSNSLNAPINDLFTISLRDSIAQVYGLIWFSLKCKLPWN